MKFLLLKLKTDVIVSFLIKSLFALKNFLKKNFSAKNNFISLKELYV